VSAIELHTWNTALGASLHSPVQNIEVVVRNACATQLAVHYGASYWFNHFPPTDPHYQYLRKEVGKVQNRLTREGRNPNHPPCVVAGLMFGFWVGLFERGLHRDLWVPALHKAFPHKPSHWSRLHVWSSLDSIRKLRNRIAHHEPIFHKNLRIPYSQLLELAQAICPHSADWIKHHSNFDNICNDPPSLPPSAKYSLNYSRIFTQI
jgi:hypothetical protein